MQNSRQVEQEAEAQKKAMRAQRILYICMGVLMLLPFVVVWLTGALRF